MRLLEWLFDRAVFDRPATLVVVFSLEVLTLIVGALYWTHAIRF